MIVRCINICALLLTFASAADAQIRISVSVSNDAGTIIDDAFVVAESTSENHSKQVSYAKVLQYDANRLCYSAIIPDTTSYRVTVSRVGYKKASKNLKRGVPEQELYFVMQNNALLKEVVVTVAQNRTDKTVIGRAAMSHLQPTSLADLAELLPGGYSKDPDMGSANTLALRETGTMNAYGETTTNNNYNTSSLGTLFVVDGAPLSTDANMQYSPLSATQSSVSGSTAEDRRNITNRGVDMRSISTDDLENVEVVQGIPSAEYGNLTSGMVIMKKIRRATPVIARLKADGYSKLFSVGKGFDLNNASSSSGKRVLNIDIGCLNSKVDPTNNLENYKRITGSARYTLNSHGLQYNTAIDYTGTFDKSKSDPNLNYGRIDEYKSDFTRLMLTNNVHLTALETWFFDVNTSVSIQFDRLKQTRLVAPQRYGIVPVGYSEGEQLAQSVFSEYIATYLCDGKPMNANVAIKTKHYFANQNSNSYLQAGLQWDVTKNYGDGQVYDMTHPLTLTGWSSRPRKYSDIPALQNLSAFAEISKEIPLGGQSATTASVVAGVRLNTLLGLSRDFEMAGKVYADPRINIRLRHSLGASVLSVGAGFGITTKMPTLNYLYPDKFYTNFNSLAYYDQQNPTEMSKFVVTTFIQDPTNYHINPARNYKYEVSAAFDRKSAGNVLVKLFYEKMNDGFRYSSVYNAYTYRQYADADMSQYTTRRQLDGYTQASNGSRTIKKGAELTVNIGRIDALQTAINITGAWLRTEYLNSQPMFETVSGVINDTTISTTFVGLYDWNDGKINQRANTNITFDTQVPAYDLIFTTSVQTIWFVKTKTMWKNGTPTAYLSAADGQMHKYTAESADDIYLQQLIKQYNADSFKAFRVPVASMVNLKVTKSVGQYLKISFFANRILDYMPSYKANGKTIRRNTSPYFGMEANIYL